MIEALWFIGGVGIGVALNYVEKMLRKRRSGDASPKKVAVFRAQVTKDSILEDGLGRKFQVETFGDDGLMLVSDIKTSGGGLMMMLAGGGFPVTWEMAASRFKVVLASDASDSVEEMLRRKKL